MRNRSRKRMNVTCCGARASAGEPTMRLSITSTTGSPVELSVPRGETVEGLRAHISHRLRLQGDRIVLLHRDRQLTAGRLLDLGVADGSKLTLVPVIEAGHVCSTARAERSMMDVLESLTEVQISDFLSGRSPLTLNLGIGAHVMYVELQLSAQNVAELQQHHGLTADSTSALCSTNTEGSTPSPPSHTFAPATDSSQSTSLSPQTHRTSFNSAAPPVNCHNRSSPQASHPSSSVHTSPSIPSIPSLPTGCPHPSSPLQAATPVSFPAPTGSIPGPCSPVPASTFKESDGPAPSTAEPSRKPGAVIESFVSHSPGVFSGTFSGTLAPCSQSRISHPRSGITIILQILNDLLRAAYNHQGATPALPLHHCPTFNPPVNPLLTTQEQTKATSKTPLTQRTEHLSKTPVEESPPLHSSTQENQALHSKLERLQYLMHQRRLRRRTRRTSQTSHPHQRRHHRP